MAKITKEEKQKVIDRIQAKLKDAEFTVFADYKGVTVAEITELRNKLREAGSSMTVLKYTLFKKAVENAKLPADLTSLKGRQLAVVVSAEDIIGPSKVLHEFIKTKHKLEILGAIIEGEAAAPDAVVKLAKMPSREELIGKVLGSINAPVSNFVGVLSANIRSVIYALKAVQAKKGA